MSDLTYVLIVSDTQTRAFDVRCVVDTLEQGKAFITAELARGGKPDVQWTDEFNGSIARGGGLEYELRPARRNAY